MRGVRMSPAPLDADIGSLQVDAQHLSSLTRLLGRRHSRAQLLQWQRTRNADHAGQKRGHASARRPARIRANLLRVGGMQLKSASAVGMHINKTWHYNGLTGIQYLARPYTFSSNPLDVRP